ncbi:hypothetical protein CDAR_602471 [Caerostris darwini]|uniref:Uncharacterized protein n=1 Tax=Caerostris darwini TaxID=1538125 RepID=A0AAV4MG66_9ARAC|nr:hypothetical protein CDAR_602471 [Caerostris darwini]
MGEGSSNLLSRRGRTMPLTPERDTSLTLSFVRQLWGGTPLSSRTAGAEVGALRHGLNLRRRLWLALPFENFIGKLMRNYFGISFVMGFCGFISARDWGFESLCSVSAIVDFRERVDVWRGICFVWIKVFVFIEN